MARLLLLSASVRGDFVPGRESERGLIHGPDTNLLSQKEKKKKAFGWRLKSAIVTLLKTLSDAFLPAANVNK